MYQPVPPPKRSLIRPSAAPAEEQVDEEPEAAAGAGAPTQQTRVTLVEEDHKPGRETIVAYNEAALARTRSYSDQASVVSTTVSSSSSSSSANGGASAAAELDEMRKKLGQFMLGGEAGSSKELSTALCSLLAIAHPALPLCSPLAAVLLAARRSPLLTARSPLLTFTPAAPHASSPSGAGDMSGGQAGTHAALTLSNAITNLSVGCWSQVAELVPLPTVNLLKWRQQVKWYTAPLEQIIVKEDGYKTLADGTQVEVMLDVLREDVRTDLPRLSACDEEQQAIFARFIDTDWEYVKPGGADAAGGGGGGGQWWKKVPRLRAGSSTLSEHWTTELVCMIGWAEEQLGVRA